MTSLRLFETDRPATGKDATSHLFETPPRTERYRATGWPYAASMVVHSLAMVAIVTLTRYLAVAPQPTPSHHLRRLDRTFVFTTFGPGRTKRLSRKTQLSASPITVAADVAPSPLPPARGDVRPPDTSSI